MSAYISSDGTDVISDSDSDFINHKNESYFRILRLKPFEDVSDNGYVCKFDENLSFRQKISAPNVYYVLHQIKVKEKFQPFGLLTLWQREQGKWKILTFAAFTNED
ncbi:MAG: hypothetical protein ACKVRN_08100 [Pyrinomonadaceae bacterium]